MKSKKAREAFSHLADDIAGAEAARIIGLYIERSAQGETFESVLSRSCPGWPPAEPPAHGRGWPRVAPPPPNSRDWEDGL